MNVIVIMGRLGADPVSIPSSSGNVTKFRVATDRYNGKDREKTTDWHSVVCFGRTAENCSQYLSKGSMCCVRGSIKYSKWEKEDGSYGYSTDVIADDVRFVSSSQSPQSTGSTNNTPAAVADNEMPF
jgi:single-strand DNA-binding protein